MNCNFHVVAEECWLKKLMESTPKNKGGECHICMHIGHTPVLGHLQFKTYKRQRSLTSWDHSVYDTPNVNSLEWGMMLLPNSERAALLCRSVLRCARSATALLLKGWLEWYSMELWLLGWNLLHTGGVNTWIRLWHSEHVSCISILVLLILVCITTPIFRLCHTKS